MSWQTNATMYWSDDSGATWHMVTDHNRQPLSINVTRLETVNRMANGTLRRYSIAKKQTITTSWSNVPSITAPATGNGGTVDGGWGGIDMKAWHDSHDGSFLVKLRKGQDINKTASDGTIETLTMMISDFSHDVVRRGVNVDFWNVSLTLEEV